MVVEPSVSVIALPSSSSSPMTQSSIYSSSSFSSANEEQKEKNRMREIEANGKLGGFSVITTKPYDTYVSRKGQQTKLSTLKLTMTKE